MAGYIIHMAIAQLYLERHLKEDNNRFYRGCGSVGIKGSAIVKRNFYVMPLKNTVSYE